MTTGERRTAIRLAIVCARAAVYAGADDFDGPPGEYAAALYALVAALAGRGEPEIESALDGDESPVAGALRAARDAFYAPDPWWCVRRAEKAANAAQAAALRDRIEQECVAAGISARRLD